jgi:hypothetical protein
MAAPVTLNQVDVRDTRRSYGQLLHTLEHRAQQVHLLLLAHHLNPEIQASQIVGPLVEEPLERNVYISVHFFWFAALCVEFKCDTLSTNCFCVSIFVKSILIDSRNSRASSVSFTLGPRFMASKGEGSLGVDFH